MKKFKIPRKTCNICSTKYRDWEVTDDEWKLLPEEYLELGLCEKCYLENIDGEPGEIEITHETWQRKKKLHKVFNHNTPDDHYHLHISIEGEKGPAGETMWCKIMKKEKRHYVVEVLNDSFATDLSAGDIVIAEWDGHTIHGISGRPMLEFVEEK